MSLPISGEIGEKMSVDNYDGDILPPEARDQHAFEEQSIQQHGCVPQAMFSIWFKERVRDGEAGKCQQAALRAMNIRLMEGVWITCTFFYQEPLIFMKLDFLQTDNLIGTFV